MAAPGDKANHELNDPHEYGDANIFFSNVDALSVLRIRKFGELNGVGHGVVLRGLSEFLLEGSLMSVSRSGFKRYEVLLNDVAKEFPEIDRARKLSGWEARFGRTWIGITALQDAELRRRAKAAYAQPANGRSVAPAGNAGARQRRQEIAELGAGGARP